MSSDSSGGHHRSGNVRSVAHAAAADPLGTALRANGGRGRRHLQLGDRDRRDPVVVQCRRRHGLRSQGDCHGRAFASYLDPDNFTSRYDAVMRTTVIDDGDGVPFQIEYKFRPKAALAAPACGWRPRQLVRRQGWPAGRSLRHSAPHRCPPPARPASELPRQLRSAHRHDEPSAAWRKPWVKPCRLPPAKARSAPS